MALHLRKIKIRPAAAIEQLARVVKKVETEIEQTAGDRLAVHEHVLFDQMPAPWPDEQRSELLTQFVFFPFRITEANNAPDGIAQIDLTLNHVGPRRRIRILEIRHKHFRTGVEGVNHHLAISRPGDLNATVAQVSRDRSTGPIAI